MPKKTEKPVRSWAGQFVSEWIRLAEGEAGVDELYERAGDLEVRHGHRDPVQVAAEDFAATATPKRAPISGFSAP
jgi:hypothetical protein